MGQGTQKAAQQAVQDFQPVHGVKFLRWLPVALLVAVPLGVLAWLGLRETQSGQERLQTEVRHQAEIRMEGLSDSLLRWMAGEATGLQAVLQNGNLRDAANHHPLLTGSFRLASDGSLTWPDTTQPLSQAEAAFVGRTRALWQGRVNMEIGWTPDEGGSGIASTRSRKYERLTGSTLLVWLSEQKPNGWIPWHWEDGLHLLFWCRSSDGGVVGGEVDRTALLSRWVGVSPERDLGGGQFSLRDAGGQVLHNFGPYAPAENEAAILVRSLQHPLQSWQLEYRGPETEWMKSVAQSELRSRLWRWGGLAILFLVLVALYIRESGRAFREARQRVNFVNQVSHELRTPLTNIRLYAELAQDGTAEPETAERLRVIQEESTRLSRLVSDILAFARDERGKLQVHCRPVVLGEWLDMAIATARPSLARRGMALDLQWGGSVSSQVEVLLDPDAATQVLLNLLSNAEKYAASGGWVGIAISQEAGGLVLRVRDRGPGIAPKHRAKIFQPFYRASDRTTDGVAGTGIGLGIARRLAERMGGRLELEINADVPGACFRWNLSEEKVA